MKKVLKTILNTIINILIVLVLIVSILIAVMALTSKATGVSNIFGFTIQNIESDSMKGGSPDGFEGGDFQAEDIVIAKATGYDENAEYEIGDIVTFKVEDPDGRIALVVHRIVDKIEGPDGYPRYQTWGDNREISHVPDQLDESEFIPAYDIASLFYEQSDSGYHGIVIRGLGSVLSFLQTQLGFFLVVLLPMIIFFLYELIRVVLNASNYKKEKNKEELEELEKQKEAEKEAAVAAAVEAAKAELSKDDAPELSAEELEQFRQFQAFKKMQEQQAKTDDKDDFKPDAEE